ncbi:MAG: polyphosphate kinase 2 [Kiloniellales bacterium]|nr:polyphosphate kinase 2 [Kiloniellales bacterium]
MAKKKSKEKKTKEQTAEAGSEAPKKRISAKEFDKELESLQVELCKLQSWVVKQGLRVVVVFEGRDAAGKGGVIKRITERVSPRVFRVVALPAPTEREKSQLYMQRYLPHFPAAGEIALFDRSWYNRAGVERVMGFCTDDQYERFLRIAPMFEREIIEDGIILIKYFFDVSQEVQEERFKSRATDPRKHWKLSPMDLESWARWWDYTKAYDVMIKATDTDYAPWYKVAADDKRSARLNCISHLLSQIPYKKVPFELPPLPKRRKRGPDIPDHVLFTHSVPELF